ncbi:hypothetical protein AB0P30_09095 [Micrococcus luteus]|uniref:hypothetical protein n=1 Tax=Micrococcus luteus TaxID=1270 RepID=UPI003449AB4E
MPQAHDTATRKRRARERAAEQREHNPTPDQYARDLVRRGLASKLILGSQGRPHGREDR